MAYTEIQEKKGRKYYYRAKSIKKGKKVLKKKIYLGVNLNKGEIIKKEKEADKRLNLLEASLSIEDVKFLDELKKNFSKEPKENFENRYESFCSLFTHNSTAIEGNTLTLSETNYLLFEGIAPSTRSLREINEVLNHKKAFDFILRYKGDITREFILELHKLVVMNTLREDLVSQIGKYRTVQVFIGNSIPPKPHEVPEKMTSLLKWYSKNKNKLHPLTVASYFHTEFEKIHPFVDGNGRTGRLIMNFILHKDQYPMINIPNSRKFKYYQVLENAHKSGNLIPFIKFLITILKKETLRF
ncbi:MAG: Fic family protein [Nanoarchaeota archaeon]|nr:Fic family protein [Nanoarchaeota archaeon]